MQLLDTIAWTNREPWKPVSSLGLLGSVAFTAYIAYRTSFGDGWVPLVDDANFAVHEAGHPLVGLFSARLAVYGGTLAQLLLPAVCMFEFWRRRETLSYALCSVWFGQSLLSVARYMADARAMQLPLAGLRRAHPARLEPDPVALGLLQQDVAMANGLRAVAWLGIAVSLGFLAHRWWRGRNEPAG